MGRMVADRAAGGRRPVTARPVAIMPRMPSRPAAAPKPAAARRGAPGRCCTRTRSKRSPSRRPRWRLRATTAPRWPPRCWRAASTAGPRHAGRGRGRPGGRLHDFPGARRPRRPDPRRRRPGARDVAQRPLPRGAGTRAPAARRRPAGAAPRTAWRAAEHHRRRLLGGASGGRFAYMYEVLRDARPARRARIRHRAPLQHQP